MGWYDPDSSEAKASHRPFGEMRGPFSFDGVVINVADGLYAIDIDGLNRRRLTAGPHHSPAWRP
jgi:hypothetical protein